MVMLNYLALHGEEANFINALNAQTNPYFQATNGGNPPDDDFRNIANGLGDVANRDRLTAFTQLASIQGGTIVVP